MKNTILGTLALALMMSTACGDDSGGGDDNPGDSGTTQPRLDGGTDGSIDGSIDTGVSPDSGSRNDAGSGLTLQQALQTSGVNGTAERAALLFPAACTEQIKCEADYTQAACEAESRSMYDAMASTRPEACRDATLDLFACFAVTDCNDYDTDDRCNALGTTQQQLCAQ